MIGDELGERVVSIGFRVTGQLAGKGLYQVVKLLRAGGHRAVNAMRGMGNNELTFKKLEKGGAALTGVEVTKQEMQGFSKYAAKYRFQYSLVREKNDPEKYNFMFKAADIAKLDAATRDFLKDQALENGGLKKKLEEARDQAYKINKARDRSQSKSKTQEKAQHRAKRVER